MSWLTHHADDSAPIRWAAGLWNDTDAVTAIEYALIASLIVAFCAVAFAAFSQSLESVYVTWTSAVSAAL